MPYDYDLFVIGAGSGGLRAARVASAHGAKVAIAEEFRIGGTCVIRGCVPKKMLVYGAHFAEDLHEAAAYGWDVTGATFNWPRLRDTVLNDVTRLEGLYRQTLDNHQVDVVTERAVVIGPNTVRMDSGREITAKYLLVATGAWPARLDFPGAECGISSNEVFLLPELPKRIVIAGGGYIANEFAGIFHAFGSDVTLINRTNRLLRSYDEEVVDRLVTLSEAKGIKFRMSTVFDHIHKRGDGTLEIHLTDGLPPIDADIVLFATGRDPNTRGLGLEDVGVTLDRAGAVVVGADNKSNIDSIYAVGDVTNRVQLTPVAIREGHAFADTVFGGKPHIVDYRSIPSAVFASPPIASVGMTEAHARAEFGADIKVYKSDFRPMKNVVSGRLERGLYKMITQGADEKVIGLHLIGPDTSEIIQGAAIAVKAGLTKAAFDDTIALHPSMAEELVLMK